LLDAGAVADDPWMTLGRGGEVLVAIVDQPDRAPGLAGEERGVNRHHGGVFLLPSKSPAGLGLNHDGLLIGQLERALQGSVDVVGALQRPYDRDPRLSAAGSPLSPGDRDRSLRLDVELFLQTDAKAALDNEFDTFDILEILALPDVDGAVDLGRLLQRIDRLGRVVVDPDVPDRFLERVPIGGRQEQDRLL